MQGWRGLAPRSAASGAAHHLLLGRAVISPIGQMWTRAPENVPVSELHRHQGMAPGLHLSYGPQRQPTPDDMPRSLPTSLCTHAGQVDRTLLTPAERAARRPRTLKGPGPRGEGNLFQRICLVSRFREKPFHVTRDTARGTERGSWQSRRRRLEASPTLFHFSDKSHTRPLRKSLCLGSLPL